MIGCGSMGGGMALLFAEHDITVYLEDPSEEQVDSVIQSAKKDGIGHRVEKTQDYQEMCQKLDSPRVFVFSLPHGNVGDSVVDGLQRYLDIGDIIIDASNENWQNTQRRQGKLAAQGVCYIGMGVSGGYQAARRGPSMCPGGDQPALKQVMPLLEKVCAKDSKGRPCVGNVGTGGCGHYVKMIHNGIEQAMMSAVAEAFQVMNVGLGMTLDEISEAFARWNTEGELRNTFLVSIAADICKTRDESGKLVLPAIQDKVVQDTDDTEGTGIWTNIEAIRLHIPVPSIATAHFLRLASGDRAQRVHAKETSKHHETIHKIDQDRKEFLEDLRLALYGACVASYVQGLKIIDKADKENNWHINFLTVTQIWRAGCIIQADTITDLMEEVYTSNGTDKERNPLFSRSFMDELNKTYLPLRRVVARCVETNAVIPSFSATLEYMKYSSNTQLPTDFYEAELDYFGKHMFDLKSDPPGKPVTGTHHFEWKPA
ncbi:6-phosphogluconate dehydrogenase (decarboxylating) [Cyphellophora europaea CBS 101466]|uniref:6-phosphogluconate dehydrogenase, decarboxylating n=1 Tax=Cyphellophora europaea (strain CBS 101466) TaxID=1220924 RepID=W2SCQ5_CYPE1|nr:6-phosphogluconate dehydrogenase (decarboxylating) [Cyphellophora europaea CBS 101466]ETN45813.1 6-phosphogluconate dehydrogenase (decarboxylating) [Cyphellophora europaea CBS 101466]